MKMSCVQQGLDEVNAAMVPCLHEAQQAQAPRLHTTLPAYAQGLPSNWRLIYNASQGTQTLSMEVGFANFASTIAPSLPPQPLIHT